MWIPVLACAGLALALVACALALAFFFSSRRHFRALHGEVAAASHTPEKLEELAGDVEEVRARMAEVEERRNPVAEWSSELGSVNLNRRGQVLRLYRRGEPSAQIASALGLSQGEVMLIIKVHELTRTSGEPEKMDDRPLIPRGIFDTNTRGRQ